MVVKKAFDAAAALQRAAQIRTGLIDVESRAGQQALLEDLVVAYSAGLDVAGVAPTGTGKSFAYLVSAAMAAYEGDRRTLISTEGKGLQAQLVDVDLPIMAQAVRDLFGFSLRFAVFKGVAEYCDPHRAVLLAQALVEDYTCYGFKELAHMVAEAKDQGRLSEPRLWKSLGTSRPPGEHNSSATDLDLDGLADLASWAVNLYASPTDDAGDRQSCPLPVNGADWGLVSSDSDHRFRRKSQSSLSSKYERARDRASMAHIVVTNHTLLAMQATTGNAVLMANSTTGRLLPDDDDGASESEGLGFFQHLVVDEAHSFPAEVRERSRTSLHGGKVRELWDLLRNAGAALDPALSSRLAMVAGQLDDTLEEYARSHGVEANKFGRGRVTAVLPVDAEGPVSDLNELLQRVVSEASAYVTPALLSDGTRAGEVRKLVRKLDGLGRALRVSQTTGVHATRWVEHESASQGVAAFSSTRLLSSRVDISGLVQRMLERTGLRSSAWVSATLPEGFCASLGLTGEPCTYPSPFELAHSRSAVFVPAVDEASLVSFVDGRGKFSTERHQRWSTEAIVRMVRANGGSALVLSATTSGAREYTRALREDLDGFCEVISQVDGGLVPEKVRRWKESESSVLVGTRSLMTGVDASGPTNSLVILDRVPRSVPNPVDEGRVASYQARFPGVGVWEGRSAIYVNDASVLVEQAMGRLIRSVSDSGMVALLDPRVGAFRHETSLPVPASQVYRFWPMNSMPESLRRVMSTDRDVLRYTSWMERFGTRVTTVDEAVIWLTESRSQH